MPQPTRLRWDDVRALLAVLDGATTTKAVARALGAAPAARCWSSLERALGGAVVAKDGERLRVTAFGARLAPRAREVARAMAALQDAAVVEAARVRVAVPSSLAWTFTAALAKLRDRRPDLALEIVSGHGDLVGADVAVRIGVVEDDVLVVEIGEIGWSLYGAKRYLAGRAAPDDPHDLRGHDVVAFSAGLAETPAGRWLEDHLDGARIAAHVREEADALVAALAGVGLALLPCHLADAEPALVRLTPLSLASEPLSSTRARGKVTTAVRDVLKAVADVAAEEGRRLAGRPPALVTRRRRA